METIRTNVTELFGIKYPVVLAGMNQSAGPELAAAVSNHGGLGVLGGVRYTPAMLRAVIKECKEGLQPGKPFGVDLLLPKVGGSARATNSDYTDGRLEELMDVIVEEKASLFVSAVGVPPKWVVDKCHAAGIPVMNMIGHPKHIDKALEVGVDLFCAQGTEAGGHTGDIATSVLIPQVVDRLRGVVSPFTKRPVSVLAAGGIYDSRGLAMALSLGADAVWVGTRFLATIEGGAPKSIKQAVVNAKPGDTTRTMIYTGRPMRVLRTKYIMEWEEERAQEDRELRAKGVIPAQDDLERRQKNGEKISLDDVWPFIAGQAAGAIREILPAKVVIDEMVSGAIRILRENQQRISKL